MPGPNPTCQECPLTNSQLSSRLGLERSRWKCPEEAVSQMCSVSLGLPHYVHALGLASGRAAIDDERLRVEPVDVRTAIGTLVEESQQSILREFDLATARPRRENFYFQALVACALAPTDDLGCFRASDVRGPYSRIMGREMQISAYARHLHGLSEKGRGAVLQTAWQPPPAPLQVLEPADAALRADARPATWSVGPAGCRLVHRR